jgi:hypothetical protein
MERILVNNAMQGKMLLLKLTAATCAVQFLFRRQLIWHDVFGFDGNGGSMLKIITDLTDEEMARLKYVRRLYWHWNGSRKMSQSGGNETISDQELSDRGIIQEQEPYVEYVKRPPHDKYL